MNELSNQKQDMLTSILNGISAMIYVTDVETDEILFINDYMKQHFGIEGDVIGQPCYKILNQGIDERCEWCPCHQLDKEPEGEVVWEEVNTLTGCHYRNTDRYIDWPNGKKVHIQHCVDISDITKLQETLKQNNILLQAVNESAVYLLNTDTDSYLSDVHQSMKIIGEAANVDRVYIWKNYTKNGVLLGTQVYEWSDGAEPQQNNEYTVNMPYEETLPGLEKLFLSKKCLNGIVSQMTVKYQDYFYPQSIVSIIMVPIFMHDRLWGFVGFDDCHSERVFTEKEESTLRSVGLLYAHAHQRNEIIQDIQETSAKFQRVNELLKSTNNVAAFLLDLNIAEDIKSPIMSSMEVIGDSIGADRVHIWRKHIISDDVQFIHEYEWLSAVGKIKSEVPMGLITPFINMDEWKLKFIRNEYVGGPVCKLSPEEEKYFKEFDVKSVVLIPIFLNEQLWGLVSVDDCLQERYFTEDEVTLLQSSSLMIASAIERNELFIKDKKSKERIMLMLDTSPLCAQIWDKNLNTIDCNEAGVQLYGFKDKAEYKERFIQCCSPEFQPDGQPSDVKAVALVNKAFKEGRCVFDWMHQTPDGKTQIPAEVTLVRVKYGDDDVVLGYTQDLRKQKEMIQNLRETSSQLEEALDKANAASRAKSEFLANMSHEMRTPLNAIINMTLIGKKANNAEDKEHALSKISEASSHLLGLVNDILDMAKIEADRFELLPETFMFKSMLDKVLNVIDFHVSEKKHTLNVNIDEKVPKYIIADEQRLAQVMTNLLFNAVKFTPEGGNVRLDVSWTEGNGDDYGLHVVVTDSGIGVSSEQQENLFNAFEQADSGISREYGGTGLGLPITKRIVELMNGQIWVESELGKGAKFIFTVKVEVGTYKESDTVLPAVHDSFTGKRLLVVEDIEINCEILIALLEDSGLIIDCAKNGKDALDMITANPEKYDIIFMDLQMPKMGGLEATRLIRALPARKRGRLPIIAMTANVFKDDIKACMDAGMDDHFGKPLDISRVFEILQKYLKP